MIITAKSVIANVKARQQAEAVADDIIGPVVARSISDALEDAGYLVIHRSGLAKLRGGIGQPDRRRQIKNPRPG